MSWDVYVMRFPAEAESVEQIPRDWDPPVLGTAQEIRAVLTRFLPGITFAPDGRATYNGDGFSVTTYVDAEPIVNVSLFIRGDTDTAACVALAITEALNARAVDSSSGRFLQALTSQ